MKTPRYLVDPAFPTYVPPPGESFTMNGISRLDYFAGLAMQGDLAGVARFEDNARYAKWCYDLAAAMLAESEQRKYGQHRKKKEV